MMGFTFSYRGKWHHPAFRDLLEAGIWAWMCDAAAWKECKVRFNDEVFHLKRGQLVTSRRFIAEGFRIGEQATRTFLEMLQNEGMISQQQTHKGTVITICNYEKYQTYVPTEHADPNQHITSSQPTANPNKKEVNQLNQLNEVIDSGAAQTPTPPTPSAPILFNGLNEEQLSKRVVVQLATEFTLAEDWGQYAEKLGWVNGSIQAEAVKWHAYFTVGKGAGKRRTVKGWRQSWGNWLENAARYAR